MAIKSRFREVLKFQSMWSVPHSSQHVGLTNLAFLIEVGFSFSSALLKVLRAYLYVGLTSVSTSRLHYC
jgi:hypothetical protein